ncbi:unnamed protein product, partial [marine sediment metagenome]
MSIKIVKNYVNGQWREGENTGYIDVENPSTGEILAKTPLSTTEETNSAIQAAAEAYKTWSQTPVARRVKPLYELASILRKKEMEVAKVLVAEMGKSIPDAVAEMKRIYE